MPTDAPGIALLRHAFLHHAPQRHAQMLPPGQTQKYHETPTPISDDQLRGHLAGILTLAAPAAHAGLSSVLPLDVDCGGRSAIQALIATAARRGLWAFGQYCPRPTWAEADQRGYVWVVFDELTNAARLQQLGRELIHQAQLNPRTIEARAHHAVTRLPFGKHTHSGSFGSLLFPDGTEICIDADPGAALLRFEELCTTNKIALVPELDAEAAPPAMPRPAPLPSLCGDADVIRVYNARTDIRALVMHYGGRRSSSTLYHCCCGQHRNDDARASLGISTARKDRYGAWVVKGFAPHCAFHTATDAFGVFCHGEGLSAHDAVKRLAEELGLHRDGGQPARPRDTAPAATEDTQRRPHVPPVSPAPAAADKAQQIRHAVIMRSGYDQQLIGARRAVLTYLIDQCALHAAHWCKRSLAAIQVATGYVRRTVQLALRHLEAEHYLATDHSGNAGHGGDEPNIYTLLATPIMAGGGRSDRSPMVKLDHDSESLTLKLERGGNPDPVSPIADPIPDRSEPPTMHTSTEEPPEAAPPPARRRCSPARLGVSASPAAPPTWVRALGTDADVLATAAAERIRQARHLFAKQQPAEAKKLMWEAGRIKARITQLAAQPLAQANDQPDQSDRLQALGVYPENARRFGDLPAATIDQAEALARSVAGDLPSLVVAFLKRHVEDGWTIPAPANLPEVFALADYQPGGKHAGFFGPMEAPDTESDELAEDAPCATFTPIPELAPEPPTPAEPAADPSRPAWISPERWQTVPVMLRGLLRGARLVGRMVVAGDAWRQGQLDRYGPELSVLIAAAAFASSGAHGGPDDSLARSGSTMPDRSRVGGHSFAPPRRR